MAKKAQKMEIGHDLVTDHTGPYTTAQGELLSNYMEIEEAAPVADEPVVEAPAVEEPVVEQAPVVETAPVVAPVVEAPVLPKRRMLG